MKRGRDEEDFVTPRRGKIPRTLYPLTNQGQSLIKVSSTLQSTKKPTYHLGVYVKPRSENYECDLSNVYNIPYSQEYESLENMVLALREKRKRFSEEFCVGLMLDIAHCVHNIHKHGSVHGGLNANCISVSKDRKRLAIFDPAVFVESQDSKAEDLKQLGTLYFFLLSNGESLKLNPATVKAQCGIFNCVNQKPAKCMIEDLISGQVAGIDTVLEHYFFWPPSTKIQFLVSGFGFIKGKNLRLESDTQSNGVLPKNGWIERLRLDRDEVRAAKREAKKNNPDINIGQDIIKNYANDGGYYNGNSIFQLLRFFRNYHAHFYENGEDIKCCFRDNTAGYWQFFDKRFPELFTFIHKKTASYLTFFTKPPEEKKTTLPNYKEVPWAKN